LGLPGGRELGRIRVSMGAVWEDLVLSPDSDVCLMTWFLHVYKKPIFYGIIFYYIILYYITPLVKAQGKFTLPPSP
jgi:hypothetical protein